MLAALCFVVTAATIWFLTKQHGLSYKLRMAQVVFEGDNSESRYASDTKSLIQKGYIQVWAALECLGLSPLIAQILMINVQYIKHGRPFSLRDPCNPGIPQVVLPLKYLEEVKRAPESKLSFTLFSEKVSTSVPLLDAQAVWLRFTLG
jgi:ent-kaurene oxidase